MTDFEKKILETINERGLAPRPYLFFLAKRSVVWTLAVVSIVLGAISVAVLIFATEDYLATGGRGFDELPLDDVFEYLPYVWLATLAALMLSAYYAVRLTPGGYRYQAWQLILAVLALCGILGVGLHVAGTGKHVHDYLTAQFPIYDRLTQRREKLSPQPDTGVLTGSVVSVDGTTAMIIKDFTGSTWSVDIKGARVEMDDPLAADEDVEIHGSRTGPATFRADTIGDWD